MDMRKKLLVMGLLVVSSLYGFGPKTVVSPRSQSLFAPLEHAGWDHLIYTPDLESTGATIAITPFYEHSFNTNRITEALFGCKHLIFTGSQVPCRDECDILADYWGLPSDYKSEVHFDPNIVSFVMDFNTYINLDGVTPGLFAQVHLPMVHTKWDVQLVECIVDPGTTFTSYPAGYFADEAIELSELTQGDQAPKTVMQAFQGKATYGDMRKPLKYGKIFGRQSESRVSDLRFAFGYNCLLTDRYHFGLSLQAAAPTGTLREAEFLFEPITGNDHHWELGMGVSAHYDFWHNEERDRSLGFYVDGSITHMFASTQKRSFDICNNGCGSRYILLQKMAEPVVGLNVGTVLDNSLSPTQYQGRLQPAINITTLDAKIEIGVQAELLAKLNYYRRGFEFEVGYNLWARSKEKLQCRDCIPDCYAIKGDAQVYGFTNPDELPVALAATQSKATINNGQAPEGTNLNPGNFNEGFEFANINADNFANAFDTGGTALNQLTTADANRLGVSQIAVRTSNPPVLLTDCDIDECSALLPKAISHTLYFSFSYALKRDDMDVIPYIGAGAFTEFAPDCFVQNSALSNWGMWLKMGLTFGQ